VWLIRSSKQSLMVISASAGNVVVSAFRNTELALVIRLKCLSTVQSQMGVRMLRYKYLLYRPLSVSILAILLLQSPSSQKCAPVLVFFWQPFFFSLFCRRVYQSVSLMKMVNVRSPARYHFMVKKRHVYSCTLFQIPRAHTFFFKSTSATRQSPSL
jgi:hypothetical protein